MSCGWTPSSTNDRMLAFRARRADEAHAGDRLQRLGPVREQVLLVRGDRVEADAAGCSRCAAPRPMAPAMFGVPASNLCGSAF